MAPWDAQEKAPGGGTSHNDLERERDGDGMQFWDIPGLFGFDSQQLLEAKLLQIYILNQLYYLWVEVKKEPPLN